MDKLRKIHCKTLHVLVKFVVQNIAPKRHFGSSLITTGKKGFLNEPLGENREGKKTPSILYW